MKLFLVIPYGRKQRLKYQNSEIMYFSNLSLEESAKDDIRFKSNYWDPWEKYSPEIYE